MYFDCQDDDDIICPVKSTSTQASTRHQAPMATTTTQGEELDIPTWRKI